MPFDLWLAFAAASALTLVIPGPTVLMVVSFALAHGRRAAWATVPGAALGTLIAIAASLAGLGALLATSITVFTIVKWMGAAYLVWLGVSMWRAPVDTGPEAAPEPEAAAPSNPPLWRIGWQAFVITIFNPKGMAFYIAFLPQFVDSGAAAAPQLAILSATFIGLAMVNALGYSILADTARRAFTSLPARRRMNRAGGSMLIGAGMLTAMVRRA